MSKNKEKLNDAFADIESKFILSTANPPICKRGLLRYVAIVACLTIVIAAIPISMLIARELKEEQPPFDSVIDLGNDNTSNTESPIISSYLDWSVLSANDSAVSKKKTGSQGTQYTFCANVSQVQNTDIDARSYICTDMFGQWATSMSMYDCEMHYDLFDKAFFTEYLCTEFDWYGFSIDQAAEVITRKAAELIPFSRVSVDFVISDIIADSSSVRSEFIEEQDHYFEKAGLNIELVDEIVKYCFDSVMVCYDEAFYYDMVYDYSVSEMFFYRCGDEWYIAPQNLEDDISIDVLHANKEENTGYFEIDTLVGIVQGIENGCIFIENTGRIKKCFVVSTDISHISVGDRVEIKHYTAISSGLKSIGDSDRYEFCVAISVELYNYNPGYTN